ncbi:MAG: TRAP transporter small permease [Variovorax sp.]
MTSAGPVLRVAVALEKLLAAALIAAVLINFATVLGRYVFGVAWSGADELQVYLMAAIAFLGAPVVTVHGLHLRMDVLLQNFTPRLRRILGVVELLLLIGLGGLVAKLSLDFVLRMKALNIISDNAHFPVWIAHTSVTLGFTLMTLAALVQLMALLRAPKGPATPNAPPPVRIENGAHV